MASQIFSGLIFCCTGIDPSERDSVKKRIETLGGEYSGHLTRKVTHLIAGRIIRSEKYKSAKELLNIPVLLPAFVDDCWTRSRLGGVDLHHMERLHAVPPLYGCHISVSGISASHRAETAKLVEQLGGQYSAELTKSCTHLLAKASGAGSEGGAPGPKIQFAVKWGIPIVDVNWLYTCQTRNMYVDERAEHMVQVTASQQVPKITSQAYDDVTLEEVCAAKNIPPYLDSCRIYLGDGLDDKRLALLKRLILVAGGTRFSDHYDGDVTHFVVHNQVLSAKEIDQLKRYQNQPLVVHDQWLLACFVAKARLEPDVYRIDPALIYRAMRGNLGQNSQATTLGGGSQPQGRSSSLWATKRSSQSMLQPGNQQNIPPLPLPQPHSTNWMVPHKKERLAIDTPPDSVPAKAFFKSLTLYLHPKLHKQYHERIVALGGTVKESFDVDYAVYPTVCTENTSGDLCKMVNEIWLSECMAEKRLLASDDQLFFAPIFTKRPIDTNDFRTLNVCPTGFTIPERDYFACLLSGLGGGFSEAFSKKNTHLLCKSGALLTGPKIDFALKTGIPCITEQWLLDSAKEGCVLPLDAYKVRTGSKCLGPVVEECSGEATPEPTAKKTKFDGPPMFKLPSTSNMVTPKQDLTPRLEVPSAASEPKSLLALSVDTPLRRDFNQRIKQVTDDLLPKPDPDRPSLGPTQAILKESTSSLFSGLVFTISQRLWHRREELHDLVTALGGTFLWTYDASCTHYLHQGNQVEESFKEFRVARHCGKKIVSPAWLEACKEERKRLPEDEYPHFYPNKASDFVKKDPEKATAVVMAPLVPIPLPVSIVDTAHERRTSIAAEPVDVPETFAATLDLALPVNGVRKTNRIVTYAGINCSDDDNDEVRPVVAPAVDRPSSTEGISQGALGLTLDDSKPRRFMLSAITAGEKTILTKHLVSLGASISDQVEWDSTVTHLVVKQVTKSEKYLAACAAGIWILRPEYIEACATAGRFLAESEYEVQPAWTDTTVDGAIKGAPKAWRMHLGTTGKQGAFDGWTVLLAVDAKRLPGFSRILKAGHAQVYTISDIESNATLPASKFTHVITSSHAMKSKIPGSFVTGIRSDAFKSIEFIAEHLLSPPRL